MRIGLILSGSYWYSPYVKIYEDVLNTNSIDYDVLSWDRDGLNDGSVISFVSIERPDSSRFHKLFNYLRYRNFLIKTIKKEKYDKLIIFGPQTGLLLYSFLKSNYNKKFFLDYRDVSIEQNFKKTFKKLLDCSSEIAISSPGFKKVLPKGFNFLISHNFRLHELQIKNSENEIKRKPFDNSIVVVSTIGAIRDISANMELVTSLKNKGEFQIQFIGKGSEVFSDLGGGYENIKCTGFYNKDEEESFFINADFVNIYYPAIISHSTALSNRFYNALIFKRPMIVTSNSIQGNYVNSYKLGLSINDCNNLDISIKSYVEKFSFEEFSERCDFLIAEFLKDYSVFEKALIEFVK